MTALDDGFFALFADNQSAQDAVLSQLQGGAKEIKIVDNIWSDSFPARFECWINDQLDLAESKVRDSLIDSAADVASGACSPLSPLVENIASLPEAGSVKPCVSETSLIRLSSIYAQLVLSHCIPVVKAAVLLCKGMRIAFQLPAEDASNHSLLFPNRKQLTSFVCNIVDELISLVRGFGNDIVSEVIRFGSCQPECRGWATVAELRDRLEPWDSGSGGMLPRCGGGLAEVFQRPLHEEHESKLEQTSKAETVLYNERKKIFDKLSDLCRRFCDLHKQSSTGGGTSSTAVENFVKTELTICGAEILSLDSKNMAWLASLFLEKYLQHAVQHEGHVSKEHLQSSYANKVRQTLGLDKKVDNDVILKLERRLESRTSSISPIAESLVSKSPIATAAGNVVNNGGPSNWNKSNRSAGSEAYSGRGSGDRRPKPNSGSGRKSSGNRPIAGTESNTNDHFVSMDELFPGSNQFFPHFIFEMNNHRFNEHCISAILTLIDRLTLHGSEGCDNINTTSVNTFHSAGHDPTHFGDVISKLKLLGKLLSFLHFHHFPRKISNGNAHEFSKYTSYLPLEAALDTASAKDSLCVEVPWIVAFLKAMKPYCDSNCLGYSPVFSKLSHIELFHDHMNLRKGSMTSNRMLVLMEIQALWQIFPSKGATKNEVSALARIASMSSLDSSQWALRSSSFKLLDNNLHEQFEALKIAQPPLKPSPYKAALNNSKIVEPAVVSAAPPPKAKPRRQGVTPVMITLEGALNGGGNIASSMSVPSSGSFPSPFSHNAFDMPTMPTISSNSSNLMVLSASPDKKAIVPIEPLTRSASLSSPSGRTSPQVKPTRSIAGSKKKSSLSGVSSSLILMDTASSPVLGIPERKRTMSSASSVHTVATVTTVTTVTDRKRSPMMRSSPVKNLFPDENKLLMERMEGSFWNQHDHLQRVHSFTYTNCYHSCIAQIKEFVAISLRRILQEVDELSSAWKTEIASDAPFDDEEKATLGAWVHFYTQQMLNEGNPIIESVYSSAKAGTPSLYRQYPENARVIKLAVYFTQKHLHSQQCIMQGYLKEYAQRKLRELQERKKKTILQAVDGQSPAAKAAADVKVSSPTQHIVSTPAVIQNAAGGLINAICALMKVNCLQLSDTEDEEAERNVMSWSLPSTVLDMANKLCHVLATLQNILENTHTWVGMQFTVECSAGDAQISSTRIFRSNGTQGHNSWPVCETNEASHQALSKMLQQHPVKLAQTLVSSFLQHLVLSLSHSMLPAEALGKMSIEVVMFFIAALPYLLCMDYQYLSMHSPEFDSLSDALFQYTQRFTVDNMLLASDVLISLLVQSKLLSADAFMSILVVLFREKTAIYYERSKGLQAASYLLPQGLLLLLGRVVLALNQQQAGAIGCPWYKDATLAQRIQQCSDLPALLMLLQVVMRSYVCSSNVHKPFT